MCKFLAIVLVILMVGIGAGCQFDPMTLPELEPAFMVKGACENDCDCDVGLYCESGTCEYDFGEAADDGD